MAHVDIEVKPLRIKVGKSKPKPKENKDAKSTK